MTIKSVMISKSEIERLRMIESKMVLIIGSGTMNHYHLGGQKTKPTNLKVIFLMSYLNCLGRALTNRAREVQALQ